MTAALATKLRTVMALGVPSVARVAAYRGALRLGLHPVLRLNHAPVSGPFFRSAEGAAGGPSSTQAWQDRARLFGWKDIEVGDEPPAWFANPFNGASFARPDQPWHRLPDFDPAISDIKAIWEWSRFEFAVPAALRGDEASIARLNRWIDDWCRANPPYIGPNWKCGQEASLRVLRLSLAALILGQLDQPEEGLLQLLEAHLVRIAPTTSYATGQDNNHGTSEAAALFVGGVWLHSLGRGDGRWRRAGRAMLEERVPRLVSRDGGFSQYSTTYHRLMLDTLSVAELFRARLDEPAFSNAFRQRAEAAARWLHILTDPATGDAPNLGHNDSTELLATGWNANRDYRPSTELAARLFCHASAFGSSPEAGKLADRLGIPAPHERLETPRSTWFPDHGLAVLIRGGSRAILNAPRFRFRPSQADVLHLDYWRAGHPLLRDGGSYSYAADPTTFARYSSVGAHNTVQFDEQEQMPRVGRFLYGDWIRARVSQPLADGPDASMVEASYESRAGHRHTRLVELGDASLRVTDKVGGFAKLAVARWRLPAGVWSVSGSVAESTAGDRVIASADVPMTLALAQGVESRHYLQSEPCTVLSIAVDRPCTIKTEFLPGANR
jgi:hypothetical protein